MLSVRVLIAGASGFIGTHLARACVAAGHEVIYGGRRSPVAQGRHHLSLDYAALPSPQRLAEELRGVDVVVNTVGILRPL
jgi:nucleoside-diphosphate-sugar epimerase